MNRPILKLKVAPAVVPVPLEDALEIADAEPVPSQLQSSRTVHIGSKSKRQGIPSPVPALIFEALKAAVDCQDTIFIQLRSGVGYKGTAARCNEGWLTLKDASIHGTKNSACVSTVFIQLGDLSQVSHIHPVRVPGAST
jgi:hypothetical protein